MRPAKGTEGEDKSVSESVKIGGIGKNPAVDKINSLQAIDIKGCAVRRMQEAVQGGNPHGSAAYRKAIPVSLEEYGRPSDEWMAVHFPAVPRPQEVYSSPEGNGILTCNLLDKPLREEQVYPAVREIQWLIGRLYPESIRVTAREFRTDACRIGWFAFVTGGTREDSMHCMFVLPLEDNMMFGSWHFPEPLWTENRKRLLQMFESIRPAPLPSRKQRKLYGTKI